VAVISAAAQDSTSPGKTLLKHHYLFSNIWKCHFSIPFFSHLLHLEYAGQSAKGAVMKIMRILFVVGCLATEGILAGCVTGSDSHMPVADIRYAPSCSGNPHQQLPQCGSYVGTDPDPGIRFELIRDWSRGR
jgi:hypothetical protein